MFRVSRAHHAVGDDGSVVCPGFLGVPFFARIFEFGAFLRWLMVAACYWAGSSSYHPPYVGGSSREATRHFHRRPALTGLFS